MPYSHYPKTVGNIVLAWVQPAPPDVLPEKGVPDFVGGPFSEINRWRAPLAPGESVVGYHDAQPFTRFIGSLVCDQRLSLQISFSNDEVDAAGHWVTDDNIDKLNYGVHALRQDYDPVQQALSGRFFVTIMGRWLKVEAKNLGNISTETLQLYVRGSVF